MARKLSPRANQGFGHALAALRQQSRLSRSQVATTLSTSIKAVEHWEVGTCLPTEDHLRDLLCLYLQKIPHSQNSRAMATMRDLWMQASERHALHPSFRFIQSFEEAIHTTPVMIPPAAPGPQIDWGDALAVPFFYGRQDEKALLFRWIVQERCRVVSVLGMGGIGKSALAVHIMHQLVEHFKTIIFRSLRDAPSCETLVGDCLQALSSQPLSALPATLEERIDLLLERLHSTRALVVLDNLECLLEAGDIRGQFRPGFLGYGQLLRRVAETSHQSCLLLTSREKPVELRPLEDRHSSVRSLRLKGLDTTACRWLLEEKAIVGTEEDAKSLIKVYGGNPLALKVVAQTIVDLFGGEIGPFLLGSGMVLFGNITDLLSEQFARLSKLEQRVLCWLAIVREPVTIDELLAMLVTPLSRVQVLKAVDASHRRSLIERGKRPGSFTLQSVVLEYLTAVLVAEGSSEIQHGRLDLLIEYGLMHAHAKEYVRQTQERLLLYPLLMDLQSACPGRDEVERLLCSLLDQVREQADYAQGYGPANLIALLRLHRGHLSGLDLSRLAIRGAYLQSVEMHDTKLCESQIRDSVFTAIFDAIWAVAVSANGKWWAASSRRGDICVWSERGRVLHLAWRAHSDGILGLVFSPDERSLATGSWDGSVKLWDVGSGALYWTGWHEDLIVDLAWSPDGRMLASGAGDGSVKLWNPHSGANLRTLITRRGTVNTVAFSPDTSLLASGNADGSIVLWETANGDVSKTIQGHDHWVMGLAFSPDGSHVASASWDRTIKIWEISDGRLVHTLLGHTERVQSVIWSADGKTLVSAGFDKEIRIWDIKHARSRAILRGHAGPVYSIAFTSDERSILSGSEDGTWRLWDAENGQCIYASTAYTVALNGLAWHPSGRQIASANSDMSVGIWDATGETDPNMLHQHRWTVQSVAWSPDGTQLASSGWDNAICIWNSTTKSCVQILRDPDYSDTIFQSLAWYGHLLASGSYSHGVQVWDVETNTRLWVGPHVTSIRRVAWNPEGTRLVSCGDDGNLCLWEVSGVLIKRWQAHRGAVIGMAWKPDGRQIASVGGRGNSGEMFVWDVERGKRVQTFVGHPGIIYAVDWSLTGDLLISGDGDGTLRWWDVESGQCLRIQKAHQGSIRFLMVSPDGHMLASCGDDAAIMIWDLDSGKHVRTLRGDRPYERLDITGITGLTEAQKHTLRLLGAIEIEQVL